MKCRLCHVSGLTVSILLHGAVASAWFLSGDKDNVSMDRELPLQLSMFVEMYMPDPVIAPIPDQELAPQPQIIPDQAEVVPEPVNDITPLPQPEPEMVRSEKPDQVAMQTVAVLKPAPRKLTPKPKPEAKIKPALKPSPSLKSEPVPEALSSSLAEPVQTHKPQLADIKPVAPALPVSIGPTAEELALQERNYRLEVVRRIENNKFFPRRARKMRQTGDVMVEFTLKRDGSLEDTRILNTTAPPILEKAALKAIQVSALFPPFPEIVTRESWSFRTSLEYRLH